MKKILVIESCRECPHYDYDSELRICCREHTLFEQGHEGTIPDWCPLPDVKADEP